MSTPPVVIIIGPKALSFAGEQAAADYVASLPLAGSRASEPCVVVRGNEARHFTCRSALFEHFHPEA